MVKIAPSVIAADFSRLGEQFAECERAGADLLHFDAMDGHFVPNISLGPMVLQAVRRSSRLPIDVHLMISAPDRYLESFAQSGADTLIVHVESGPDVYRTLTQIHRLGKMAGIALNPGTPASHLHELLDLLDQILVMTVNPGFGGQPFIAGMLTKIEEVSAMIAGRPIELNIDGGVDTTSAPQAVARGATMLVAGTSVFGFPGGIAQGIAALRA